MNAALRTRTTTILAAFALALTGCFISPGKFTSELVLEDGGAFSFTYDGEIFFLGLSDLAQMEAAAEEFEAEECYTDNYDVRDCTETELAEQRAEWDAGAQERIAKAQKEAEDMAKMMGGMMGLASLGSLGENAGNMPEMPSMEGTFTIVTNGMIRANNTDEGSTTSPRGEVLTWEVDGSTQNAPTALIKLAD